MDFEISIGPDVNCPSGELCYAQTQCCSWRLIALIAFCRTSVQSTAERLPQGWLSANVCVAITKDPLVVMVRPQPRSFTIVVGAAFICTVSLSQRQAESETPISARPCGDGHNSD